ncbi:MAG TPA: hypothetical protein DDW23_05400 [Planctomycetes bacterium]|nr:hypothetical protein [Planctomycetota bacterium]
MKIVPELALFENPWGLLAGLGALAWMWLTRRGATRTWGVGGLGPFAAANTDSATFLRFPPSAWLGACGFVFAALALSQPILKSSERVLLWDRSPSCELSLSSLAGTGWAPDGSYRVIEIGNGKRRFGDWELGRKVRSMRGDWTLGVFTDRREPTNLPKDVQWIDKPYRDIRTGTQAGILAAWPNSNGWKVHWKAWGKTGQLKIQIEPASTNTSEISGKRVLQFPLEGVEGVSDIGAYGGETIITLLANNPAVSFDRPIWASLSLAPRGSVCLAGSFSPEFRRAVQAALPGVPIYEFETLAEAIRWQEMGAQEAFDSRVVSIGTGGEAADWAIEVDPFSTEEELDAVVQVSQAVTPWWTELGPESRSVVEVAPVSEEVSWPGSDPPKDNFLGVSLGWEAGLLGLVFYIAALFFLYRGR